jgi:hypothetical protein
MTMRLLLIGFFLGFLGACSHIGDLTRDNDAALEGLNLPEFTIEGGRWEIGKSRLWPNSQSIELVFEEDDSRRQAFVGWDFNRDGTIDVLDVLDRHGQPSHRLYDFDFDGIIDLNRTVNPPKTRHASGKH